MADTATNALILLTAALAVLFAAQLATVRWWRSDVGRQQALSATVFALVFGLAGAYALGFRDYPARAWVRLAVWSALAVVFLGKNVLIARAQHTGKGSKMINLRREPALILAAVAAVLGVVATLTPVSDALPAGWDGAAVLVANAAMGAWTAARVKPLAPVAFTYLAGVLVEALALWHFDVPAATVGALNIAIVAVVLLVRGQVTPAADPAPTAPDKGPVR